MTKNEMIDVSVVESVAENVINLLIERGEEILSKVLTDPEYVIIDSLNERRERFVICRVLEEPKSYMGSGVYRSKCSICCFRAPNKECMLMDGNDEIAKIYSGYLSAIDTTDVFRIACYLELLLGAFRTFKKRFEVGDETVNG